MNWIARTLVVVLALVVGAVIAGVGYTWTLKAGQGFVETQETWIPRAATLYLVMGLGMLARAVQESIQSGAVGWRRWFVESFQSASFATALVVSPIVFYAVYNATKEQPDNVVSLLLAFQNGFFWQVILERRSA